MMEIFSAKTLDEAKELAVQSFGISKDLIDFQILEEPKKSIFGRLKGEYKVKATYNATVETVETVVETPVQEPIAVPTAVDTMVTEEPSKPVETETVQQVASEVSQDVETTEEEEVPTPEEVLEKAKVAQEYVASILEKMGIDTSSEIIQTENGAIIDFKGDGTGTIIGKRGETLDALQYLSAMICNKGEKGYFRITLDSCGYRAKRKLILEELAKKVSKNVLRTGRSQSLEPMNPYERRIIHSTISEIEGVTSRSIGEEPFRKVIISSTNPKKYSGGGSRKGGYNNRGKRGGNNKYRGNGGRKKNYQPRSLDLKTSFEKDYRKPKPEDNLKEGLYGKIEF
ncbi:MAG: Jag N-terminal domain-containing protein [Ruminococcus sp.]|nr:Jag N-terminal domain-containing protein [Ruminococcus sp.]